MPEISVVVPIYNAEKTLHKCIDSLLNQTYQDLEIILIDDGSTDASAEICTEYTQKHANVHYFYQQNQGVSAARNHGIERSSGAYIGFIDSDDYADVQMYEKMWDMLQTTNSDICIAGYNIVSEGAVTPILPVFPNFLDEADISRLYIPELIWAEKGYATIGVVTICLYRSALAKRHSFPCSVKLLEDTLFNIECLEEAKRICFLKEPLYDYCVNYQSATNRYREDAVSQILLVSAELKKTVEALEAAGVSASGQYYSRLQAFFVYLLKNEAKLEPGMFEESLALRIRKISDLPIFREMLRNSKPKRFKEAILFVLVKLRRFRLIGRLL